MMLKKLVLMFSILLAAADGYILYLWLVHWQRLETFAGMMAWGAALFVSLILYVCYKKLDSHDNSILIGRRFALGSAVLLASLAVVSIIIEYAVRSMP